MQKIEILRKLLGTECECGKSKRSRFSHCRTCFFKLPSDLRKRLYKAMGEGYEEAFADSLKFLKQTER